MFYRYNNSINVEKLHSFFGVEENIYTYSGVGSNGGGGGSIVNASPPPPHRYRSLILDVFPTGRVGRVNICAMSVI